MFSQLREIKRRQQLRQKGRRQTEQPAATQRLTTTLGSASGRQLTNGKQSKLPANQNKPAVNRSTIHTTKPIPAKQPVQVDRSATALHKLRECPSSSSTIGNSSKVSSVCSRPVSPGKSIYKLDLSFVCEEETVAKPDELPGCEQLQERLEEQQKRKVDGSYIARHRQLTQNVRAILLEWMMQLSREFQLNRSTYQQAVALVDHYLSHCRQPVKKTKVQLIGVTALSISCKLEEVALRSLENFSLATGSLYTSDELEDMEKEMAKAVRWKLRCPTPCFWVEPLVDLWVDYRKSLHLSDLDFNEENCDFKEKLLTILYSVMDSTMMDIEAIQFRPWQLVTSFMLLGLCYLHGQLELDEIQYSLTISAKYMLRSGIVLVIKYGEFLRKALQVDIERELTSCIQFVASYFFICKRYPVTVGLPQFCLQQQHCGRELDFLARRKHLHPATQ